MSALSIQPTYPIFTDIDGQPLEDGYVWIGQANLDPQGNPINVYWDAALTQPAGQPIRTLAGYPANSGTPARLYVNSDYSIRVMNKNGSTVYSAPAATERYSDAVVSGVNAQIVVYDPPFVGGVSTNVEAKLGQSISILDFGADPTGAVDSSAAIQSAIAATFARGGGAVYAPAGQYRLDSTITFPEDYYIKFYGDGSLRTRFVFKGTGNAMEAASNTTNKIKVCFEGFWLYNDSANSTNGIFIKNGQYESDVIDVFVDSFNKAGTQTIDGYTFYYSGIVAMYAWGLRWEKVQAWRNGNGMTLIQFNSTLVHPNCLVNVQNGLYLWDGVATVVGGVFQGNDTANNGNAASIVANAEIVSLGGNNTLDGVYFEGEGVNPPWTIIVDGVDDNNRSTGTKIVNCNITRSTDTAKVRECIYVRLAEETVIEGNTITPTSVDGVGAAAMSHINVATVSLNTRIGHNSYRGRHAQTGTFYSWLPKIINTANLPQYVYPFAKFDGGLKTVQKRLRLEWLLPAATLAAPLAETQALVPGTTLIAYHSLTRIVWLTNIQAILAGGLSAGSFTVRVYNRENDAGGLVLVATATGTPEAGIQFQLLNQHPYQTRLEPGNVVVTVETSATFAPVAANEIYVELEFEEFDNH